MSFFKDLKEDIAQSVNELAENLDENSILQGKAAEEGVPAGELPIVVDDLERAAQSLEEEEMDFEMNTLEEPVSEETVIEEPVIEEPVIEEPQVEEAVIEGPVELEVESEPKEDEIVMEDKKEEVIEEIIEQVEEEPVLEMSAEPEDGTEPEVTVITKGTIITGGIKSDTSLVVKGTIEGDVECQGKLTITGKVAGNTIASEIYVNTPRLEGDINSKGIVKIDVGTVVIGDINCTSVLVAGAVKGNIEVNGPVIIDSTAVVKGDVKAKSIQINSGAVIDGHCSLQFADVDLESFFE